MAFRRSSPRLATPPNLRLSPEDERSLGPQSQTGAMVLDSTAAPREWPTDETAFLRELLRCHDLPKALVDRLMELAGAPPNQARIVDRLAVALAAHFNFLPLENVLETPVLLYGAPGTGVSTLAAKLAAKFDEHQILVISSDPRASNRAELEEHLEVLGLPLAVAPDAATLRSVVAGAGGRKVIIDTACGAPTDPACANQIREFTEATGAQAILVVAADTSSEAAGALATAAARIGTRRMIATRFDVERYIGAVLIAADTGKLALVAASVTPHFAFGLRVLTPENLARRFLAAALRAERWRIAPL
jgi:flagellar biosynthesis protein FlhF